LCVTVVVVVLFRLAGLSTTAVSVVLDYSPCAPTAVRMDCASATTRPPLVPRVHHHRPNS
jgi:hypothetical protein